MPLEEKQRAWLQLHLGVETGSKAKKVAKKRTEEYTAFFDKKAELLELATQLAEYDFAKNRSGRVQREAEAADDTLHRQAEVDLENALKEGLKSLAALKSRTDTDIKNAKSLETRMGVVRGSLKLIVASPVDHPESIEIALTLRAATRTAQNSDFEQAYKDLAAVEKSSAVLAKTATTEAAEKRKWDDCRADAVTCIEILKVMPNADPKTVADLLATAQVEADKGNFKAAYEALKNHKKTYDAAYKLAEGKQQAVIDNEAKADMVNDRLEAIDLLLVQVAALPGLTAWIKGKEDELKAIRKLTDTGEYAAAWKDLEKNWNLAKLTSAAEKESSSQSKNALKNVAVSKLNSMVQADLIALQDLATDDRLAAYRDRLARGMDVYISVTNQSKPKADAVKDAEVKSMAAMTLLDADINSDVKKLGPIKKACEALGDSITNGLKMLASVVSTETRALSGFEWERLSAALGVKEFEKTQPKLEKLLEQINELLENNTRDTQAWETQLGKLGKDISGNIKKVADCPVTSANAAALRSEWDELTRLGRRREPGEALAGLPGLTGLIAEQLKLVKQFDDLKEEREAADKEVTAELKKATDEIDKLKVVLAKARASGSPDVVVPIAFDTEHTRLFDLWNGNMNGALKPGDLKTASVVAEIKELINAVKAAASDTAAIDAIASTQVNDENRFVYLKSVEKARVEIAKLAEFDSRSSIRLEKQLAKIDKDSAKDFAEATTQTDGLLVEIATAIAHAENVHKNTLESVRLTAAATRKKVAETEKGLGKKVDAFKDFFNNLRSLIDDMEKSLLASSSVAALMTANHEFNEILRPMYEIVEDANKGGKDKLDYSSVYKTAEAQSKYLNTDKDLADCQPTMKSLLLDKFQGIQTSIKAQSPREATATLAEFQKELDEIKEKAGFAKLKRTTYKLNAKTAKAKLKKLDPKLAYTSNLESKLKGLDAMITSEHKEEVASRDLVLLLVEVDRALNDPAFAIEQEQAVRKAEIEAETTRKEWESRIKAFDSTMAEVKKAMDKAGDDADLSQVVEIEGMRKESKSIAKGGDYATALKKLELTRQHAVKVIQNPVGEKVTSRNSLPKDQSRYKDAIKAFNTHMSNLTEFLKKEVGTSIDAGAFSAAEKMLKSMQFEFDIKVFDKAIELLSNKQADTAAKRKAREEVLATVRSYQGRLDKGPLMLKVLLAPFDKIDPVPAYNVLRIALNSLDVNVRRCV